MKLYLSRVHIQYGWKHKWKFLYVRKKTVYIILYKGVIAFIVQQPKLSQANVLVF